MLLVHPALFFPFSALCFALFRSVRGGFFLPFFVKVVVVVVRCLVQPLLLLCPSLSC